MLPGAETSRRTGAPSSYAPSDAGTAYVVGFTERGATGPVEVSSLADFEDKMGGRETWTSPIYDWLDTFFHEGGSRAIISRVLGPTPTKATINITDGSVNTLTANAKHNGSYGADIDLVITAGGGNFTIEVQEDGETVETSPSLADKAAAISWSENESDVVDLVDTGAGVDPAAGTYALAGGTDDHNNAVDANWATALANLPRDLGPGQIVAPGRTTAAAHQQLADHAKDRIRTAVGDLPDTRTVATLTALAATGRASDETRDYIALFGSWAVIPGIAPGTYREVPWSAVVCGHIAALASQGYSPNIAAAGEYGAASYVVDLTEEAWDDTDRETLNDAGVNIARFHRGAFRTYGFRTLADPLVDDTYLQLQNARLDMMIRADGQEISDKYVFKQIDPQRHTLSDYHGELVDAVKKYWDAGSLYGDSFEEAVLINTGPQVNTPTSIANREIKAVIEYAASPGAEKVRLVVGAKAITEGV